MGTQAAPDVLKQRLDRVQKTAVDRAYDLLESLGNCLIVMTTGTGKTTVGAKIIRRYPEEKVLWLTQTEELITQTFLDLQRLFGEGEVGFYKRSVRSLQERIVVASLQTIEKEEYLKTIPKRYFGLLVVDEAHHAAASTWDKVIRYFQTKKLGLTATPHRMDGKDISELFGDAAFHLGYEQAKDLKLIAEETYRVILTNSKVEGIVTRSGEYTPGALDRLIISENRNHIIVDSYKKYGRTFMRDQGLPMKAICFCITVSHAVRMRDLFRHHGISSEVLVSKHSAFTEVTDKGNPLTEKERREVYGSFLDGSGPEILCVVNVLNEGKNIPDVGCLLMARPTRSAIIFQQQMGRGCRRVEGYKEKFLVLDYVDLMNRDYPPISLSRLIGKDYRPNQIITEYYRGKDPVVVDEYIQYLSSTQSFYPEKRWSKARIAEALIQFYEEHGIIRTSDLVTHRTGLPNKSTIRKYWGSVAECFEDLGLKGLTKAKRWSQQEAEAALKRFAKKKGSIRMTDLTYRNDLPSRKIIERYWGSWTDCVRALGFTSHQLQNEDILRAIREFKEKQGRYPKKREFSGAYGLPNIKQIWKRFGSLNKAFEAV